MKSDLIIKYAMQQGTFVPKLNEYLLTHPAAGDAEQDERATGVIHPSSLGDKFCARRWWLTETYRDTLPVEPQLPGLTRTFDIGSSLHRLVQRYAARMKVLYGTYQCRKCGETTYGFEPEQCPVCSHPSLKYREVDIRYKEYNIHGHTDGILVLRENRAGGLLAGPIGTAKKYVFEFKTMNPDAFKLMHKPLQDHVVQASVYVSSLESVREQTLSDMEAAGLQDTEQYEVESMPFSGAIILYQNKGVQEETGFKDLKEYVIPILQTRATFDQLREPLLRLKSQWENGICPERECESAASAKRCSPELKKLCFSDTL